MGVCGGCRFLPGDGHRASSHHAGHHRQGHRQSWNIDVDRPWVCHGALLLSAIPSLRTSHIFDEPYGEQDGCNLGNGAVPALGSFAAVLL